MRKREGRKERMRRETRMRWKENPVTGQRVCERKQNRRSNERTRTQSVLVLQSLFGSQRRQREKEGKKKKPASNLRPEKSNRRK